MEKSLEEIASELRELNRHSELLRTSEIGRLLVERCFSGSVASWRQRRNRRNSILQRLSSHPGCSLSRAALQQAVGVYAVTLAVPIVMTLKHIEVAHLVAVASLAEAEQERWLLEAESRAWNPRQLREAVQAERRDLGERRGRPRATVQRRALSATRSSLERLESSIGVLSSVELGSSEQTTLKELRSRISAMRSQLDQAGEQTASPRRSSGTWPAVLDADSSSAGEDEENSAAS